MLSIPLSSEAVDIIKSILIANGNYRIDIEYHSYIDSMEYDLITQYDAIRNIQSIYLQKKK